MYVVLSGALDVGVAVWLFQRPYPLERGAQRTPDCHRGVFFLAVVYVVPVVLSWS